MSSLLAIEQHDMPKPRHWPMEKLPTPVFPAPLTKFSALLDLLSLPQEPKQRQCVATSTILPTGPADLAPLSFLE